MLDSKLDKNSPDIRKKEISQYIDKINDTYKSKIEDLISTNYGIQEEDKVLSLFKEIGLELSDRNNNLLKFLKENYGLDFLNNLDFSGGLKIEENNIENIDNENIKKFFSKNYTRKEGSKIHSRGYAYYFNFEGFEQEYLSDTHYIYNLNSEKYFNGFEEYYTDTINGLNHFSGKRSDSLSKNEKEILKLLLEHYKNILLFSLNFLILSSDKNYLSEKVLNIPYNSYKTLYDTNNLEVDLNKIYLEISNSIELFSSLLLNIDNNEEIKEFEINKDIFCFGEFFKESARKQYSLLNKDSKSGKQTDNEGMKKNITKNNQKLYNKLLRITREQDNPIKQLFSCYNVGKKVPSNIDNINISGLLYGGIEMPFFMKYVLEKIYNKNPENINIDLTPMSNYHLRTTKEVSTGKDYKLDTEIENNNIQILLDDNIWNGVSMHTAESILGTKGAIISGVSEVGLRRQKMPSNPFTTREILSKTFSSSNVTPIKKSGGKYENLVNDYIKKKLPNLVGKL